jgi:hypothetical protein
LLTDNLITSTGIIVEILPKRCKFCVYELNHRLHQVDQVAAGIIEKRHMVYNPSMTSLFPDTRPEAEAVLIGLLRNAPAWRKLEMVGEINQAVKTLMLIGLRERFPEDSPEVLHRRLADLLLGVELAQKVYGPFLGE